jgi:prevent-host-death family protein
MYIPASELQKNFGLYQDKALTEPIFVTRNGREKTVLLSVMEYHRLKQLEAVLAPHQKQTHDKLDLLQTITATPLPITLNPEDKHDRKSLYGFEEDTI